MRATVLIAIAGAAGALARYGFENSVSRRFHGAFPLGTFVVNITGAFLLGFLFTILTERFRISPSYRSAITIGFLGAYTTFSTLMLETVRLWEDGAYLIGMANVVGSTAAGIIAVLAGIALGKVV
ncbi:MAG: fluoride efflux transporter CrcB [Actinomycetota bacterium]|nr:fluoride efflux transporter CrcB [Actinomycetota bacterium]